MKEKNRIQIRHLFDVHSGSTPETGKGYYWDGDIAWVTPEDISSIEEGHKLLDTRRKITEEGYERSGVKLAAAGSIVLTKRAPIGNLAILGITACSNQGCFLLVKKRELVPEYYYYYLVAHRPQLQSLGSGSTFMELSLDDLKSFKVPFIPTQQQQQAVQYINKEIENIYRLISLKEKQLTLLHEKRQALISQAIYKGLNPNVKMKESGIEWLGEIPAKWEIKKIKYLSQLKSGSFITADSIRDKGFYPVYGGNGLRGYTSQKTHSGEFILIGRQGALCGNINYAIGNFWASEHAVVCTPLVNYDLIWFGELLRLMNLNQYSVAAAQPGLSVEVIKNLLIPVPSIEEQEAIGKYIRHSISKIDTVYELTTQSIKLLKERETALISTTITG